MCPARNYQFAAGLDNGVACSAHAGQSGLPHLSHDTHLTTGIDRGVVGPAADQNLQLPTVFDSGVVNDSSP